MAHVRKPSRRPGRCSRACRAGIRLESRLRPVQNARSQSRHGLPHPDPTRRAGSGRDSLGGERPAGAPGTAPVPTLVRRRRVRHRLLAPTASAGDATEARTRRCRRRARASRGPRSGWPGHDEAAAGSAPSGSSPSRPRDCPLTVRVGRGDARRTRLDRRLRREASICAKRIPRRIRSGPRHPYRHRAGRRGRSSPRSR